MFEIFLDIVDDDIVIFLNNMKDVNEKMIERNFRKVRHGKRH